MINGTAPIYARITVNGKRAEISIKQSVMPDHWNAKSESVKGSTEEARLLNSFINMIRGNIEKHYMNMVAKEEFVTADAIKAKYLGLHQKERTIDEVFEEHNKMMAEQVQAKTVVKETLDKYWNVKRVLSVFIKQRYHKTEMTLKELNHRFVVDFIYHLKTEKKVQHNTAMTYVKKLKKVVSFAISNEWIEKDPFRNFRCNTNETSREYLTKDELARVMDAKLSNPVLERLRDVFVFQCYTGYAYGEMLRLTKDHFHRGMDGTLWCSIQRDKTKNKTAKKSNVPLLPIPFQIFEKYKDDPECNLKGKALPVESNTNMNKNLKQIARICGIKKNLTTHIGRHTFATTVALANGVPIESISSMLGHKQISTTQIYAKVLDTKVSEDMQKLKRKLKKDNI